MSGSFRQCWLYLPTELWEPLAEYSAADSVAPLDLFSDLFETASDFLSPVPGEAELEESRNDPVKARARFLALQGVDFVSEMAIVQFVEAAHDVVGDFEIVGFQDFYRRLIRLALRKFNLRYRLDDPFVLRFLLPGSFDNLYAELNRLNAASGHVGGLLGDFEKAFDRYVRTTDPADLKTCIAKASNFVEGLASATHGAPGTLGALCDQLRDWPHDQVRDALKSLYKFCCDYPGIRHGGNPKGVRRNLAARDVTIASLLLLAFSGYLSPAVDERAVLGI